MLLSSVGNKWTRSKERTPGPLMSFRHKILLSDHARLGVNSTFSGTLSRIRSRESNPMSLVEIRRMNHYSSM
jgi:hypothetical protein